MSQFHSFSVMHPAHLEYMSRTPVSSLEYLFQVLDELDPAKRDPILEAIYMIIIAPRVGEAVTGKEMLRELLLDEVSYDIFRRKCLLISQVLDGRFMAFSLVTFTLQQLFNTGNITSISKRVENLNAQIENLKQLLAYKQQVKALPADISPEFEAQVQNLSEKELVEGIELLEDRVKNGPEAVKETYALYTYFCENVVEKLNGLQ